MIKKVADITVTLGLLVVMSGCAQDNIQRTKGSRTFQLVIGSRTVQLVRS